MEIKEVENAVRKVFEEERTAFWVPAELHYNDHRFVRMLRKVIYTMGTITLGIITPALLYLLGDSLITQARGETHEKVATEFNAPTTDDGSRVLTTGHDQ